jgi:threonine/homoserine/homoserine lactone efflux protein
MLKLWLAFAITDLFISMTPGPAVLLVISQGIKFGVRASIKVTLGVLTANLCFFTLSAAGLSALLIASANLFLMIKWVGAGYLIFLGIRLLLSKGARLEEENQAEVKSERLFVQGFITHISNPKAIIFFTALLPQFLSDTAPVTLQLIILGIISVAVEFPILFLYGWLAEGGGRLIPSRLFALPDRIAGLFLIGTGVSLALVRKQ